jgi:hypothetical protein
LGEGGKTMKTINDLHEGECVVITQYIHGVKEFHGYYSEKYQCVFFAICSTYEIIGYKQ